MTFLKARKALLGQTPFVVASSVRSWFNLSGRVNLSSILDRWDISLTLVKEGACSSSLDPCGITLNPYSTALNRFMTAHHLGHMLMHEGASWNDADYGILYEAYPISREDQHANDFACCLLMPLSEIDPTSDIDTIAAHFGVPKTILGVTLAKAMSIPYRVRPA